MPVSRGDIHWVDLNPTRGREQAGRRPAVVISSDEINRLPLVVVVAIGTSGSRVARDYPVNVRVSPEESGLPEETVFMGFQIRALDPARLSDRCAGLLSLEAMERLEAAIRLSLSL